MGSGRFSRSCSTPFLRLHVLRSQPVITVLHLHSLICCRSCGSHLRTGTARCPPGCDRARRARRASWPPRSGRPVRCPPRCNVSTTAVTAATRVKDFRAGPWMVYSLVRWNATSSSLWHLYAGLDHRRTLTSTRIAMRTTRTIDTSTCRTSTATPLRPRGSRAADGAPNRSVPAVLDRGWTEHPAVPRVTSGPLLADWGGD